MTGGGAHAGKTMKEGHKRTIPIPEWHEMALRDEAPPVRILVQGNSMFPLIRINRDYVTIQPLTDMPETGDIVLFHDPEGERFVLHRVWEIRDGRILTWGDNCNGPDAWQRPDTIWGRVTLIERGKRKIRTDRKKGMILARFWHPAGKVYRPGRRIAAGVWHRVKRLFR